MQSRTHTCGALRITDAGKKVQLSGWLENFREVGAELGFVVIRDFYGTTQIVIENAEMMKQYHTVYKGEDINTEMHLKSRDKLQCLHLGFSKQYRLLIINHIGEHLDNSITHKVK